MPLFVRKLKVDTTSNHSDGAVPSNSQKVDNESLMTKVQYYERKLGKGFFVSPINTRCFKSLHTLGFFKVKMAIFTTQDREELHCHQLFNKYSIQYIFIWHDKNQMTKSDSKWLYRLIIFRKSLSFTLLTFLNKNSTWHSWQ